MGSSIRGYNRIFRIKGGGVKVKKLVLTTFFLIVMLIDFIFNIPIDRLTIALLSIIVLATIENIKEVD